MEEVLVDAREATLSLWGQLASCNLSSATGAQGPMGKEKVLQCFLFEGWGLKALVAKATSQRL